MLKRGIKLLPILASIFFGACNSYDKHSYTNKYVEINFDKYRSEYFVLNDSIRLYKDSLLFGFLNIYKNSWIADSSDFMQIDSLICINSSQDKLVTTMNISLGNCNDCKMDAITKLLGKKIKGKWFFFEGGGTLAVPRDMYGKDEMHPLSFHELSQIGRKNFFSGAIIKNDNGELVVDDKWVDAHFYNNGFAQRGWTVEKNKAQFDSVHWFYIMDKWKHKIDTNEYKRITKKPV